MLTYRILQHNILEDFDKHILYSSNFDHYCKSLLSFLSRNIGANTVFLAFHDPEKAVEPNPIVYGKRLPRRTGQAIARAISKNLTDCSGIADDGSLTTRLVVRGMTLGLVGALFSRGTPLSQTTQAEFRFLCEHLKKDFWFIREQVVHKRRLADLDTLYQISKVVSDTLNLEKLLSSIVEASKKLLKAEACSLALADPINQELTFTVAKGPSEKMILQKRIKFGQGIAGKVVESGKAMLIADAKLDKRFYLGMDKATGFTTRSVLCVPMKLRNNVIGAIEVLNPIDRPTFSPDQIPMLSTLAQEAAVSIENARLFHLATTDGLTGLATIRYFKTLLEHEMPRSERHQRPLSLIMLDIDFFKKVNDTYGHPAGDVILRELASLIRTAIRQEDIPARYGGEEFIIMLPEASRKESMVVAERMRTLVQDTRIKDEVRSYSITVSVGVATMMKGDQSNTLIERVDQQLYRAKQTGRNKVCSVN